MAQYDTAQICRNGHLINSTIRLSPQRSKQFCDQCGIDTISNCDHCKAAIRGAFYYFRLNQPMASTTTPIPAFCEKCGKPFPWTESRWEAALDLADQLALDIPERTLLEKSIEELIRDTPKAPAEAMRFKNIVERAAPWAMDAFNRILISVLSEPVKRLIWPG